MIGKKGEKEKRGKRETQTFLVAVAFHPDLSHPRIWS
jgi:hypothetical protein